MALDIVAQFFENFLFYIMRQFVRAEIINRIYEITIICNYDCCNIIQSKLSAY